MADSPILGLVEVGEGCVVVYGDSNCLDSSHMVTNCYWLLRKMLDFTGGNIRDPVLFSSSVKQNSPLHREDNQLPSRRTDVNFSTYSAVVGKELICGSDSVFEMWGTKGYSSQVRGTNRRLTDPGRGLNSTVEASNLKHSKSTPENRSDSLGNSYLSMFYGDELDVPVLVASHWLVPAIIAVTGLLLVLSFWRIRQKRRRRRKSPSSGRYSNV